MLINKATGWEEFVSGDIRKILSPTKGRTHLQKSKKTSLSMKQHETFTSYVVSNHKMRNKGSLIDRGENGGLSGKDVCVISTTDKQVDVTGIDHHQMTGLKVVTAGGVVTSESGDIILILNQYVHVPTGSMIHLCIQDEAFGNLVNDRPCSLEGKQFIQTTDRYIIPLAFSNGRHI